MQVPIVLLATLLHLLTNVFSNDEIVSYNVAVVNYAHIDLTFTKNSLELNIKNFIDLIKSASEQNASDIIIFPEYGLIDKLAIHNDTDLEEFGTFIPNPIFNVAPCDNKTQNFSMYLIKLSCAARKYNLYVVINLIEKDTNLTTKTLEYYNSNVVLDRYGSVIARYRKINLYEEPFYQPGTELVKFQTDFNVTFGIFTDLDILFKNPATDILYYYSDVTDVIVPTSWYTHSTILEVLKIMQGYSRANDVNVLTSRLQKPFQNKNATQELIQMHVQQVSISTRRNSLADTCEIKAEIPEENEVLVMSNETYFLHDLDDQIDYILEPLYKNQSTQKQICAENKEFCCNFTVVPENPLQAHKFYKLAIFDGFYHISSNKLLGFRVCMLIMNFSEENNLVPSVNFRKINIKPTTLTDEINFTYFQPFVVNYQNLFYNDMEYGFCQNETDKGLGLELVLRKPLKNLRKFGIIGRVYNKDRLHNTNNTKLETSPTVSKTPLSLSLIIVVISFSIVILICVVGVSWKFCKNI